MSQLSKIRAHLGTCVGCRDAALARAQRVAAHEDLSCHTPPPNNAATQTPQDTETKSCFSSLTGNTP